MVSGKKRSITAILIFPHIFPLIYKEITTMQNIFLESRPLKICALNVKPSHYHKAFGVDTLYALLCKVLKRRRTFPTGSTRSID